MKAIIKLFMALVFLMAAFLPVIAQETCFVFYNVENLFDTKDDPAVADEEFTPEGEKHWTYERYMEKIDHIARVLVGIGEWQLPGIVGLCEIENEDVLKELTGHRLLKEQDYRILHKNSPDARGIDVALLYKSGVFDPIMTQWIRLSFVSDTSLRSRDILYAKGLLFKKDTIHIMINHWPSRYGGVEYTTPKRFEAAYRLRQLTDSISRTDKKANVIIAGDLNDTPADASVLHVLGAKMDPEEGRSGEGLYNLMAAYHEAENEGTLKYKADWDVFDQIIVSKNLAEGNDSLKIKEPARVYAPEFLLEKDEQYLGMKPFRTYAGPKYLGGYSDHLPVYILLYREVKEEESSEPQ